LSGNVHGGTREWIRLYFVIQQVRGSISRKIPCSGQDGGIIPCSRELIRCSPAQGIRSQTAEFADVFDIDFR
jgi:hypothetical protein